MTNVAFEDDKNKSVAVEQKHHQLPPSVQGVSSYPLPPPPPPPQQQQPAQSYGTEPDRLPCFGIGIIGWLLFILGFFFGAIPWYIGFFLLLFSRNPREKPGYIACAVGAVIATIFIVIGTTRGSEI